MARDRILVVEDDEDIQELIVYNLQREGFETLTSETGEDAVERAEKKRPDLILLDLMLPSIDGLQVCRLLKGKEQTRCIPIMMVTAKGEEADIVTGLELGADDYVTKPFRPRELVARVKAVLRRRALESTEAGAASGDAVLAIEGIEIHPGRREVKINGEPLNLTYTEFGILHALAQRPGWVFTRYQIVDAVHGDDYAVTDRSVDVQIVGLRKKLGEAGALIETVRGVGYRFKDTSA